jgi:hypothetical protein
MESHEIPIYITPPCYILALDGYSVDRTNGQPVYDQNLQFVAQNVGVADEPALVLFSKQRLAEDYLAHMDGQLPIRPLEFSNNDSLKSFLRLAASVYRIVSIDPNPVTGTTGAGVPIEEILQNLEFPGVAGL